MAKFKNRRNIVEQLDGGTFGIAFKKLDLETPNDKTCSQTIINNKIVVTAFHITRESAYALMKCLESEFNRIDQ